MNIDKYDVTCAMLVPIEFCALKTNENLNLKTHPIRSVTQSINQTNKLQQQPFLQTRNKTEAECSRFEAFRSDVQVLGFGLKERGFCSQEEGSVRAFARHVNDLVAPHACSVHDISPKMCTGAAGST